MTTELITLGDSMRRRLFADLDPGSYEVYYSDSTHHGPDEWHKLLKIEVAPLGSGVDPAETEPSYTITPDFDSRIKEKSLRSVQDSLSLALTRVGLVAPVLSAGAMRDVISLLGEDGLILIPDTNALHSGVVHWLLRVFNKPSVWIFPLVASLTQIQSRDATLKGLLSEVAKPNNTSQALRSRSMVNGSLGLLERNRGRSQIIELDPSLLRYLKPASKAGSDPDQSDVLEDRLMIEGIHSIVRSMRTRTTHRVVTSDVNVGRILQVEGIPTLFIPSVMIDGGVIDCVRYDPFIKSFAGSSLSALMWELAHGFGTVKVVGQGTADAQLQCYYPGKSPAEWQTETLRYQKLPKATGKGAEGGETSPDPMPARQSTPAVPARVLPEEQASTLEKPKRSPAPTQQEAVGNPKRRRDKKASIKPALAPHSSATTVLPRASLPQMFQILGVVRKIGPAPVERLLRNTEGGPSTSDTARRALDILIRTGLVDVNGATYRATRDADFVDIALRQRDLDAISALLQRFQPYAVVLRALQERGRLSKSDVKGVLEESLGKVGSAEGERLPRFHTLLGQAYSEGGDLLDGSLRPADRDAIDAFHEAFHRTSPDGLSRVVDLLRVFCQLTRMSPWAAKAKIEGLVTGRDLGDFTFQPAAGGRPILGDEIIAGSLDSIVMEKVAIDRFQLGEQPVFTVGERGR